MTRVALAACFVAVAGGCTPIVTLGDAPDGGPPVDASPGCGVLAVRLSNATCTLWGWNGNPTNGDCIPFAGCDCAGPDCDRLRPTREECLDLNRMCWNSSCTFGSACPSGFYCAHDDCNALGTCMAEPADCAMQPPSIACGCSGVPYASACQAHRLGEDVTTQLTCGVCNGIDATGIGGCMTELGWRYEAGACQPVVGCSCTGMHCGLLSPTQMDCELTYAMACASLFPCAGSSCVRGQDVCVTFADGSVPTRCVPLPMTCLAAPGCDCLMGQWMGMCSDAGGGALSIVL